MIQLLISFIANGDKADPIQIIKRLLEQLEIDFKRQNLLEYDASIGTSFTSEHPSILLVHRVVEPNDNKENLQIPK